MGKGKGGRRREVTGVKERSAPPHVLRQWQTLPTDPHQAPIINVTETLNNRLEVVAPAPQPFNAPTPPCGSGCAPTNLGVINSSTIRPPIDRSGRMFDGDGTWKADHEKPKKIKINQLNKWNRDLPRFPYCYVTISPLGFDSRPKGYTADRDKPSTDNSAVGNKRRPSIHTDKSIGR